MNIKALEKEILEEIDNQGKAIKRELESPVKTWVDGPSIRDNKEKERDSINLKVEAKGTDKQVNKYKFVNAGTKKRWALMSQNWQSKTRPKSFTSGRGRGYVVIAGKRAMQKRGIGARPGIKAREWTKLTDRKYRKIFIKAIISANNRGLEKLY